ncbi:hypothetical protein GCM10009761_02600 [Agromyces terreus]
MTPQRREAKNAAMSPASRCTPACAWRPRHPRCSIASIRRSASSKRSRPTNRCSFTGADSLDTVAAYIGMLGMDFTVESPPELRDLLGVYADRYRRAAAAHTEI